jgi:hypothetical protein
MEICESKFEWSSSQWLMKKHSEYWAATRSSSLNDLRTELPRDVRALNRKQCRLVTGLLTGHYTLRRHLHGVSLSDTNCGQEERSVCHMHCQCWDPPRFRLKISSERSEPVGIGRSWITQLLSLSLTTGLLWMVVVKTAATGGHPPSNNQGTRCLRPLDRGFESCSRHVYIVACRTVTMRWQRDGPFLSNGSVDTFSEQGIDSQQ